MENYGYSQIVGNSSAPYINSLINSYGVAANYFATDHPSQPNYLELTSGTNAGISDDCTPPGSGCTANVTNLGDRLESAGKTWKAYMEDATSTCPTQDVNNYYTKHDPWVVYNDIRTNASRCNAHVVPYPKLSGDLANLPNFVFITPNECNDMHDCSIKTGDTWLSQQVPPILNSTAFTKQSSLLVIVWDEDDGSGSNQVAAIFAGSKVKRGFQSPTSYTHYSLLHTVESAWGLAPLTADDSSAPLMIDIFDPSLADKITSSGTYLGFLIVRSFTWSVDLFNPLGITVSNTLALSGQTLGLGTNVAGVGQVAQDVSTNRLSGDENTQAFLLIVFTMGIISLLTLPVVFLIQFILGKFSGVFWKKLKS